MLSLFRVFFLSAVGKMQRELHMLRSYGQGFFDRGHVAVIKHVILLMSVLLVHTTRRGGARLLCERSGSEHSPGTLCCDLRQVTLTAQCLSTQLVKWLPANLMLRVNLR